MSQYSVKTNILNESGENLNSLARELNMYHERINNVLSQCSEELSDQRAKLSISSESINELSWKTKNISSTLYNIIDYYTHAERSAMNSDLLNYNSNGSNNSTRLPKIRSSTGPIFFDRTIIPDWLQMAVLKYEQANK